MKPNTHPGSLRHLTIRTPSEARPFHRRSTKGFRLESIYILLFTASAPCAALLVPGAKPEAPLNLNVPPNITLCKPVNFTWTGGTPPYWLYIYGDLGSDKLLAQNTTGIPTTWFFWIPDIPAVPLSAMVISVGGSAPAQSPSFTSTLLVGNDSRCLDSTTTATSTASFGTIPPSSSTVPLSPSWSPLLPSTSSTAIPTPSVSSGGLSKPAIIGIAVAASCVGVSLARAVASQCASIFGLRHRKRVRQLARAYPASIEPSAPGPEEPLRRPFRAVSATTARTASPILPDPTSCSSLPAHSEGYSVVAEVGGSGAADSDPASLALQLEPQTPPALTVRNLPQPDTLPPGRRERKGDRIPVEARWHGHADRRQDLGGMVLQAAGEGGFRSHAGGGSVHDVYASHSIGRGEAEGWVAESNSEGTALPPYAP